MVKIGAACAAASLLAGCGESNPQIEPAGQPRSGETRVLESGAALLQTDSPLDAINIYLVGFHPMKDDPAHQLEAHHFCNQVNEEFAQCVLFDGNTAQANMNGVEYIISERLFNELPDAERQYWHPHNYEILSGQLVAPNIPAIAEHELMEAKMNSYGKTWHVWDSGSAETTGDRLPLGEAKLAWSFNRDGEAHEALQQQRDTRLGMDSSEERRARSDLVELARPQSGVDALHGLFPGETFPIPDVEEAGN